MRPRAPTHAASKRSRKNTLSGQLNWTWSHRIGCMWKQCKAYRLGFRQFSLLRTIIAKGCKVTSAAFTDILPAFQTEMTAVKEALSSTATLLLLRTDTFPISSCGQSAEEQQYPCTITCSPSSIQSSVRASISSPLQVLFNPSSYFSSHSRLTFSPCKPRFKQKCIQPQHIWDSHKVFVLFSVHCLDHM